MIYRRQRRQYVFAAFLAVIAVVNVLFFFILNRPAQTEYAALQDSIDQLLKQAQNSRKSFANLQRTSEQLGRFDQDKQSLLMRHLIHRDRGYSHIVELLDGIVQRSGVKKTVVTFNRTEAPQAGLQVVSITLPVQGNYSNVARFIRELEQSDTFFLITEINVEGSNPSGGLRGTGGAGATGAVSLSLALETYFYQ